MRLCGNTLNKYAHSRARDPHTHNLLSARFGCVHPNLAIFARRPEPPQHYCTIQCSVAWHSSMPRSCRARLLCQPVDRVPRGRSAGNESRLGLAPGHSSCAPSQMKRSQRSATSRSSTRPRASLSSRSNGGRREAGRYAASNWQWGGALPGGTNARPPLRSQATVGLTPFWQHAMRTGSANLATRRHRCRRCDACHSQGNLAGYRIRAPDSAHRVPRAQCKAEDALV